MKPSIIILVSFLACVFVIGIVSNTLAGEECSNASLRGAYGKYTTAAVLPAGTPRVLLGRETFDGQGNWSSTFTVNDNGRVTQAKASGTYTVNADCTATLLSMEAAFAEIVLVDGGKETYQIRTDPPSLVLYGVSKKQFPDDDDEKCSDTSLNGTYGVYSTGTVVPGRTPRVVVLHETFDGEGNWSSMGTVNDNGTVTHVTASGTYTVNADCTGTQFFNETAINPIVLVDGGKEFYLIRTDPPTLVVYGVGKKQFPDDDEQ